MIKHLNNFFLIDYKTQIATFDFLEVRYNAIISRKKKLFNVFNTMTIQKFKENNDFV